MFLHTCYFSVLTLIMIVFGQSHHLRFLKSPNKDLTTLFLAGVSRKIGQTFISVFSSIYIYQLVLQAGYDMKISILSALGFYITLMLIKGAAIIAAEDYSRIHGFKNSIETSLLPFVISVISFILAEYNVLFLIPAAVFWGIHAGFYWWGYHGYFIKSGDYKSFGKELGEVGVLETIAAILAPILGSVIVDLFGFRSIYLLSLLFMFIAVFLISKGQDKRQKHDTDLDELIYLFKKHKTSAIAYTGTAVESTIYAVIWPLFLFLFSDSVLETGTIISLAVLFASIIGVFAGDIEDKSGEKKLVSFGTPIVAASWVLRTFFQSVTMFVIADSLWNVGQKLVNMPMNALMYKKAVEKYTARAIMFREMAVTIGAALGLILISLVFYFWPNFVVIFMLTIIFSFLTILPVLSGELDGKKR